VKRASLLPLAAGGRVNFLHVIPRTLPPRSRRRAFEEARTALAREANRLSKTRSDEEIEEEWQHYRQRAVVDIADILARTLPGAAESPGGVPAFRAYVRYGAPRSVIKAAVKKLDADLLLLGTHAHAGLAHAFLGTVAGDVLRDVPCDVLVVPPRRATARTRRA
jgi:nucleotide-binding universal stress UspA family protein